MASFPLKLGLVSHSSNWVCVGFLSFTSAALLCLEAATASFPLPGIFRVPHGSDLRPDFLPLESVGLLHQQPQPPPWQQASPQQLAWAIRPGAQPTLAAPCVASFSFSATIAAAASSFSSGSTAGPSPVTWVPRVTSPVALAAIAAVAATLLKPLMEKRRRERMNRSLARLRLLLLEATRDERLRNPKMEKAEILQKTVEFLKTQPLPEGAPKEDALLESYRNGHRQCLAQASRFLQASPGLCPGQKAFCMDRICHCMEQLTPRPQPELPCASLAPSNPRYEARPCYGPSVFGGCSPPLGGPSYAWPPPPTPGLSGSGLQPCLPSLAPPRRTEGCSRAPQSRLSERWGPPGLGVWRPWP